MKPVRFYHLTIRVFVALAAFWGSPAGAVSDSGDKDEVPIERLALPPRSIADIVKLLDRYKPDPTVAASVRKEADALPPQTSDRDELFRFYWMRGLSAGKAGRIDQQILDMRKAAEYGAQATPDHVRLLRNLASAETQGGNLLNGVRVAEEAWRQTPKNQLGQSLGAEQLMVHQYVTLGDFESARKYLREAEASFTLLRRAPRWADQGLNWTALMERGRAEVFAAEGRPIEAEGAYRKSLRSSEAYLQQIGRVGVTGVGQQAAESMVHGNQQFREGMERSLASTLLAQGKLVEAEIYSRQALKHTLERVGRASVDTAQGIGLLARVLAEQGRDAESSLLAEEALHSYEAAGAAQESLPMAMARRALGSALVAQGKFSDAVNVFADMQQGLRNDPELLKKVGSGDIDWVQAMLRTGNQQGAERMAKSMLENAIRKFGDVSLRTAEVRAFYAMALSARGDREEAVRLFQAAVPQLLEQARGDAEAETGTVKRQRRLVTILESYLKLLSEMGEAGPYSVGAHADEAFRIADIARGSAVQRALTASAARANISDPQLAGLARREQDVQRRINTLSGLLTQLLSAPPEQQLPKIQAQMRADIDQMKHEREALRKEISGKFPDYADLVDPKPATVAQVAKSLRPGEALLAFYFGAEAGYVWALKADGKAAFARVAMSRADLAKDVASLRNALDPGVATIDEIPPFDLALAHKLYARLLEPVQPVWHGAKLLLVAPHAELGQLPLALLPTQPAAQPGRTPVPFAGYKAVPWLMKDVAIAQLPSVTALASLRKLPPGDASRRAFIGFGDPLFSKQQADEAGVKVADARMATRGVFRLRNAPHTSQMDSAGLALLPRLPDTNDEIREIGRVLGADPVRDIYLQKRATEKTVLETDLADRRVVMFATHGLVPGDLDGLTEPALALTSPEVVADGGDGFLTMDKVLSLRLNADWVVLSACNTASGEGAGSEAVSGLGRAFFYAGARALLVSNWPVETVAARTLMTDLFRRQAADPRVGKGEALRAAMLGLMDGPGAVNPQTHKTDFSYAHPLFWAPFVVVGD